MLPCDLETRLHPQLILMSRAHLLSAIKAQGHLGTECPEQVRAPAGQRPSEGLSFPSTLALLTFTDLKLEVAGTLGSRGNSWQVWKGGL